MEAITIFPENKNQEKTLKDMLKKYKLSYQKSKQIAKEHEKIKELEKRLEDLEDTMDMKEIEKRTNEPNIPAEKVYKAIESKWK